MRHGAFADATITGMMYAHEGMLEFARYCSAVGVVLGGDGGPVLAADVGTLAVQLGPEPPTECRSELTR